MEETTTPNNSLTLLDHTHNEVLHQGSSRINNHQSQVCPMCEAYFPPAEITHEDFVTHVNGHFTFDEDPETLHNYEIIEH